MAQYFSGATTSSHPTVPGTIVATFSRVGAHSGIWRSTDGATWTHPLQGLPAPELFHRTTLAYTPSQPDTLYALVADTVSQDGDGLLGCSVAKTVATRGPMSPDVPSGAKARCPMAIPLPCILKSRDTCCAAVSISISPPMAG